MCKVLSAENISEWNEEKSFEKEENADDTLVKEKLMAYLKSKSKLIDDISEQVKIAKSAAAAAS